MKGIIIGGGIAGLTTAIALQKHNIDFQLFESAPELKPLGAGIALNANGLNILKKLDLDLYNEIKEKGHILDYAVITDINDQLIQAVNFKEVVKKYGEKTLGISRGDLQSTLNKYIHPEKLFTNKRLETCKEDSGIIKAEFTDGSKISGDFLIGCDGIKSAIRNNIIGDIPLRYSGQTCWRALINFSLPKGQRGMKEIWGNTRGLRFGYLPVNENQAYWYATDFSGQNQSSVNVIENLLERYKEFNPFVHELIKLTPEKNIMHNDIYDFVPIKKWVNGNIALVGDSAHSTTPNLGQGGNQALESSLVIAECLAEINDKQDISKAFEKYQNIRIEKATKVVNTSWMISKITNIEKPFARKLTQYLIKHTPDFINQKQLEQIFDLDYLNKI